MPIGQIRMISNRDDLVDSRDVIARIEELEPIEDLAPEDREPEEVEELAELRALAEEASDYAPDWSYGEVMIRDSYFEEYARELAEDIGAHNSAGEWPLRCIDWSQAAGELQMDYTAVDWDGVTYWVR